MCIRDRMKGVSLINYSAVSPVLLGFLMGFGVLLGDSVESFFKRRRGIKPGKSWFPWDQLDCMIGGVAMILPVYVPTISVLVTMAVLTVIIHVSIRHAGYYIGVSKEKW